MIKERGKYNYEVDKVLGDQGENIFIKFLKSKGFYNIRKNESTIKSELSKWDIEAYFNSRRWTFEVKTDSRAADTPNLCIEHSRKNGVKSGISVSSADFFISIIPDLGEIWIVKTEKLRKAIEENKSNIRTVPMGDNLATLGYLLNRKLFRKYYRSVHTVEI